MLDAITKPQTATDATQLASRHKFLAVNRDHKCITVSAGQEAGNFQITMLRFSSIISFLFSSSKLSGRIFSFEK